jgi:4-hydroxybenzoate polyprenyltransferase
VGTNPCKNKPGLKQSLLKIKNYLSLVKFSHTIFAMPFALLGFSLGVSSDEGGSHKPLWLILLLIVLCMIFARSAAMGFNRLIDKMFDALNTRTAVREIPSGIISERNALTFVLLMSAAFLITTFFINTICFLLSPVALFVILLYSYTKRFTPLCHLVLGVGLSLAPIGAYLAVVGHFNILPVLISFTVLFWVSGFDIIYALQDEEFDKTNKLRSMPQWLGGSKALRVSEYLHFLAIACLIYAGFQREFGWLYWVGVIAFAGFLIYQHLLVKPGDLKKINLAFFTANGIASVVFCVLVIIDLFVINK